VRHYKIKKFLSIFFLGFSFLGYSCSGLELSEKEKLRQQNAKGEFIYRKRDERQFTVVEPTLRKKEPYPWEEIDSKPEIKNLPTKE